MRQAAPFGNIVKGKVMGKPRGMPTQGAQLLFKPVGSNEWLKVESLNQLDGPKGTSPDIEITDFDSEVEESINGLPNIGDITTAGNYLDEERGPNILKLEDMYVNGHEPFPIRICLPSDSTRNVFVVKEMMARIGSFDASAKVKDKQIYNCVLKATSKPVRYDPVDKDDLADDDLSAAPQPPEGG